MRTPAEIVLRPAVATGIGSLPHTDAGAGARFALDAFPDLPAVPSLPRRSPAEGMLGQAASGVPGVSVDSRGGLVADRSAVDADAVVVPDLDGPAFGGLRAFLELAVARPGPVKAQVTGPVTFAVALSRAGVTPGVALAVATRAVTALVVAVLDRLRATPEQPAALFLDEPGLVGLADPTFPYDPESALDALSAALAAAEPRAVTGVHCCGPTDWAAVRGAGPVVLSLPVEADMTALAPVLARHLDEGGWVAWGAVPTHGPVGTSADPLWRRLGAAFCAVLAAGCDPAVLRARAVVTPACGLAEHGPTQASRVVELTRAVSRRVADQATATFVSAGA